MTKKKKSIVNVLNGERLNVFLPESGVRERCPLSPLLFKIIPVGWASTIKTRKKNKKYTGQNGRNKTVPWHNCWYKIIQRI